MSSLEITLIIVVLVLIVLVIACLVGDNPPEVVIEKESKYYYASFYKDVKRKQRRSLPVSIKINEIKKKIATEDSKPKTVYKYIIHVNPSSNYNREFEIQTDKKLVLK